ncbi:hypothetical protein [Streptomyces sp. NBC_01477]|uniref:hypothetical protein n=1 Tax=Streptomyces sp. NBC_01477 TaxID=2976015 RepID=UPI002E341A5E|nr:hypothetical protein [Streptomyces sp. NBC_01477]
MADDTADWVYDTVLGPAIGFTTARTAGSNCACQGGPQWCSLCSAGAHEGCFDLSRREGELFGRGPGRPALEHLWLADRLCRRPCACPLCHQPPEPAALFDLAEVTRP